jgi:mitochondrial fission protein ELM1
MFNLFAKKPVIWVVSDGSPTIIQSAEIAKRITNLNNIYKYSDIIGTRQEKKSPDFVIGVGFKSADEILEIKHHFKSKPKAVIILDPLKNHDEFDTIILPSYEPYPKRDNVFWSIGLATYINQQYLQNILQEYEEHQEKKFKEISQANLAKPFLTVILGGKHTGGNISENDAIKLAEYINNYIEQNGGTALISTSPRTEIKTSDILRENIKVSNFFYDYKLGRHIENPYDLFLSLADNIIVTGDSVRMMCEACSSGKKVAIYTPEVVGFQYPPLIEELIKNNHAINFSNDMSFDFEPKILDEAGRIAAFLKQKYSLN